MPSQPLPPVPGLGEVREASGRFLSARPDGSRVVLEAGPRSDRFHDPGGEVRQASAPVAWFEAPEGDFVFGADVEAELVARFDAAALMMRVGDDWWLKLAHELSPQGVPLIVSVVSSPLSDDANGPAVEAVRVGLRVLRRGRTVAGHWRVADGPWQLARYAACPAAPAMQVGLSVQSPLGEGCRAAFSSCFLEPGGPADIRTGE